MDQLISKLNPGEDKMAYIFFYVTFPDIVLNTQST